MVFENTDCAEKTIGILERRFDKPWGGDNMTMLFGEIYYLRSTELVRRPSDILGLFQYAKRNRAEFTGRGVLRYFTSLFITLKRINSPLRRRLSE